MEHELLGQVCMLLGVLKRIMFAGHILAVPIDDQEEPIQLLLHLLIFHEHCVEPLPYQGRGGVAILGGHEHLAEALYLWP